MGFGLRGLFIGFPLARCEALAERAPPGLFSRLLPGGV